MAPEQRRLAAILFADVVGSSRLMGQDESGTVARLLEHLNQRLVPVAARRYGRVVRLTGDGGLVEFGSAVDALSAAIEFQQSMIDANHDQPEERAIVFRIGLHLGDVIVEGDDIYGDDVNVAARLEAEAPANGIVISRTVQEAVAGRLKATFEDLGNLMLKNIERPVRAFSVTWYSEEWQPPATSDGTGDSIVVSRPSPTPLPLPDKPSIAVLPFQNMSGDPEQEYFADGIAEDIITALSKSRALFVIARNSSFTYKGKAVPVKDVGRELGVRYVLEGSTRKVGSRVRVTAQLIEATTEGHLWAESYDRDLADIFPVQDEIAESVTAAIQPAVERSERERAAHKAPEDLDAWECYHRGMWHLANTEAEENTKARSFFYSAVALDPKFARADAALALTYLNEVTLFRPDQRKANIPQALQHAGNAIKNDATDATAHAVLARALWMSGSHAESLAEADLAVRLDPNSAAAHAAKGGACLWGGRPRDAIQPLQTAMRLSPFDPLIPLWLHFTARAHYWAENYADSIAVARQLRHSFPNFRPPYNTLIAALGQTGQIDEARIVLADAMERFGEAFRIHMSLPLSELRELRPEDREHLLRGFRKAGLLT